MKYDPYIVKMPIRQEKFALARKLKGLLAGEMIDKNRVLVKTEHGELLITVTQIGGNGRDCAPQRRQIINHNYDVRHGRKLL